MRYGIMFGNVAFRDGDGTRLLARAVEGAGFESLWTVEHIVVPSGYVSPYPYADDGRMPGPDDMAIPEPFTWLAYAAACTTRLKLGTGITVLPQRNVLLAAKETATLDVLSGGRLLLGIGTGWLREEFEAMGVPFEGRGDRTDEYIEALRTLWREEEPSFEGRHVRFDRVHCRPRPLQGCVPIIVGGHSDRAARRAGLLGDGFYPGTTDRTVLARSIAVMRDAAEAAGRDPDGIEVTAIGTPDPEHRAWLQGSGVSRILLSPPTFAAARIEEALAALASTLELAPVG